MFVKPVLYKDCFQTEIVYALAKYFAQQYPIEESFLKKWAVLVVDPEISCFNKTLTVSAEDILVFKDPVDKQPGSPM